MTHKIRTKIMLGFMVVILMMVIVSGIGFHRLNMVTNVLTRITNQNAQEIENAVGIERYVLRTILEEKNYLLYRDKMFYERTRSNIEKIYNYLDKEGEIAGRYNNLKLAERVEDARKAVKEYESYFKQDTALLERNRKLEWKMRFQGREVIDLVEGYSADKDKELSVIIKERRDPERAIQKIRCANQIQLFLLEARRQEKNYIIYREKGHFDELKGYINNLKELYENLEKDATSKRDKVFINKVRKATQTSDIWKI